MSTALSRPLGRSGQRALRLNDARTASRSDRHVEVVDGVLHSVPYDTESKQLLPGARQSVGTRHVSVARVVDTPLAVPDEFVEEITVPTTHDKVTCIEFTDDDQLANDAGKALADTRVTNQGMRLRQLLNAVAGSAEAARLLLVGQHDLNENLAFGVTKRDAGFVQELLLHASAVLTGAAVDTVSGAVAHDVPFRVAVAAETETATSVDWVLERVDAQTQTWEPLQQKTVAKSFSGALVFTGYATVQVKDGFADSTEATDPFNPLLSFQLRSTGTFTLQAQTWDYTNVKVYVSDGFLAGHFFENRRYLDVSAGRLRYGFSAGRALGPGESLAPLVWKAVSRAQAVGLRSAAPCFGKGGTRPLFRRDGALTGAVHPVAYNRLPGAGNTSDTAEQGGLVFADNSHPICNPADDADLPSGVRYIYGLGLYLVPPQQNGLIGSVRLTGMRERGANELGNTFVTQRVDRLVYYDSDHANRNEKPVSGILRKLAVAGGWRFVLEVHVVEPAVFPVPYVSGMDHLLSLSGNSMVVLCPGPNLTTRCYKGEPQLAFRINQTLPAPSDPGRLGLELLPLSDDDYPGQLLDGVEYEVFCWNAMTTAGTSG